MCELSSASNKITTRLMKYISARLSYICLLLCSFGSSMTVKRSSVIEPSSGIGMARGKLDFELHSTVLAGHSGISPFEAYRLDRQQISQVTMFLVYWNHIWFSLFWFHPRVHDETSNRGSLDSRKRVRTDI
jgi:hypothetical protein